MTPIKKIALRIQLSAFVVSCPTQVFVGSFRVGVCVVNNISAFRFSNRCFQSSGLLVPSKWWLCLARCCCAEAIRRGKRPVAGLKQLLFAFERTKCFDVYSVTLIFIKRNLLYKNVDPLKDQNFRNVLRTFAFILKMRRKGTILNAIVHVLLEKPESTNSSTSLMSATKLFCKWLQNYLLQNTLFAKF